MLAVALNILAQAVTMSGDLGKAAQLSSEADVVTEATGTPVAPYGEIFLTAFPGREAELSALIDATVAGAEAAGQGTYVQYTRCLAQRARHLRGRPDTSVGVRVVRQLTSVGCCARSTQ